MLITEHDIDGKIIAYCEYIVVDKNGTPTCGGEYCWVNNVWCHHTYNHKNIFKKWVKQEHKKVPQVKWLYFKRDKYNGRVRMYDIKKLKGD